MDTLGFEKLFPVRGAEASITNGRNQSEIVIKNNMKLGTDKASRRIENKGTDSRMLMRHTEIDTNTGSTSVPFRKDGATIMEFRIKNNDRATESVEVLDGKVRFIMETCQNLHLGKASLGVR